MAEYKGSIELIGGLTQKNNGDFPLVHAKDVAFKEGRLPEYLPVFLTQEEYDALEAAGKINANTPYFIREEETSE